MKVRRSYLWAGVILVAIGGWLGSGMLMRASVSGDGNRGTAEDTAETAPPEVRVATITAVERGAELIVRGRSQAARRVVLRAETAGRIVSTPHAKGRFVEAGTVLCELDIAEREARLAEAQASVDQTRLDWEAATTLKQQGFTAATEEAARRARLDAAMAALRQIEIEIERTRMRAPFAAIVEERPVKVGSWLAIGDSCATLVDPDPMLIVGEVSERDVSKIKIGMTGTARLVTGEDTEGTTSYIATTADAATRTFRVEMEVDNAGHRLRDGVTAQIAIPLEATMAHRFSPAILTLDDAGRIGVRTVDDDDIVQFAPVDIIADGADGVWVKGLPDQITVITVGQEYVQAGQRVRPVTATASASE